MKFSVCLLIVAIVLFSGVLAYPALSAPMDSSISKPPVDFRNMAFGEEIQNSLSSSNSLPYLVDASTISVDGHAIPVYGLISENSPKELQNFQPWGSNNLKIDRIEKGNGVQFNAIEGRTLESAGGFALENLSVKDALVLLVLGDIEKSKSSQLSFSFTVEGNESEYRLIFVHGPLFIKGWNGTKYYEQIESHSSKLINLRDLLGSRGITEPSLRQVTIVIQKDVLISAEFRIDIIEPKDTEKIRMDGSLVVDNYIFHNLGFIESIKLEFRSPELFDNVTVVENGWIITSVIQSKTDGTELTTLELSAQKPTSRSLAEIVPSLDVPQSIMFPGPKDLLFITTLIASILIYPFRKVLKE